MCVRVWLRADGCAHGDTAGVVISHQMCPSRREKLHTACQKQTSLRGDTGVCPQKSERNKLSGRWSEAKSMVAGKNPTAR